MPGDDGLNVNIVNYPVIHGQRGKTDSSAQLTELTSLFWFHKNYQLEGSAVSYILLLRSRRNEHKQLHKVHQRVTGVCSSNIACSVQRFA